MLGKFQIKGNFNKSHLIIHEILIFKTLWVFIKNDKPSDQIVNSKLFESKIKITGNTSNIDNKKMPKY